MDRLNSWIGVFANIGVLIGIAFVVVELNQSQLAAEREADAFIGTTFLDLRLQIAENTELANIYVAGLRDPHSLSDVDMTRFNSMLQNYLVTFDRLFEKAGEGLISSRDVELFKEWFSEQFAHPGGLMHYVCARQWKLNPAFLAYVDQYYDGDFSEVDMGRFRCSPLYHGPIMDADD